MAFILYFTVIDRYLLSLLWVLLSGWVSCGELSAQVRIKHVALTMDNIPSAGKQVNLSWTQGYNYSGARALEESRMPLVGFVNEKDLIAPKERDERAAMVGSWLLAGAEIGNGTFSDVLLGDSLGADWFERDVLYGERIIRPLVRDFEDTLRYFRFPGMDLSHARPEDLDRVQDFLDSCGYTPVTATIRFDDERFNTPYINSKIENDTVLVRYIGEKYIEYFKQVLDHYEYLSQQNFSRQIAHILSLRCSEINNDMLGYLLYILWEKGYRFVTLEEALADPLYREHLSRRYRGGYFWDYAHGLRQPDVPVRVPALVRALYDYQTY